MLGARTSCPQLRVKREQFERAALSAEETSALSARRRDSDLK